jgi:putative ABC transport system permease protein
LWFAIRLLVRRPAFSLVNILTLGLAIGACATIYTVVYGITLQPLPYPRPDQLVQLWQLDAKGLRSSFSDPNFQDVRDQSQSFRAVAQFSQGTASAMVGTLPVRVRTASVSRDFFDVFRVEPALGRGFHEDERRVGAARVAIVDASFWRQHFGAAADLSNARLIVRGEPHTIVGVMPADFDFPASVDLWLPREATPANPFRTGHDSQVVARLADEAPIGAARREGSALARRLKQQYGDGTWMEDLEIVPLRDQLVGDVRPTLNILLAAVALLLAIACANLSNLTLVRVASRARELAVRSALGAGRARLMLPLIAESFILSAVGGAVGLGLSTGGVAAVGVIAPGTLPRLGEAQINWAVAAFVFAITPLAGLALSGAGAVATVHWNNMTPLKTRQGTSRSSWLRSSLVTGQLAVSVVLLVTAGLLGRSFQNLLNQNPGFRTEGLLAIDLSAPGPTVTPTPERIIISDPSALVRQARQNEQLLQRLAALPGVLATGGISPFPMSGGGANGLFGIVRPDDHIQTMRDLQALARDPARVGTAEFRVVSEGYFRAMGFLSCVAVCSASRTAPTRPMPR